MLVLTMMGGLVAFGITRLTSANPDIGAPAGDSAQAAPDDAPPAAPVGVSLPVTVSGNRILVGDKPWWFVGYNSFTWSGDCGTPQELMSADQVDSWFASMRHDGHGAVRLMFFPGFNPSRLDRAVAAAKRNNIYLIVTLDNGVEGCGVTKKDSAWYADPGRQEDYVRHLTAVVQRYRGESAIAWFEYLNEPSWADGALRTFYDRMGSVAHGIDPGRLFGSGAVAPYWFQGNENYLSVNQSPGVDIASLHEYDITEAESHHGSSAVANAAGKPLIVGEFGVFDPDKARTDCAGDLSSRPARVQAKVDAYLNITGYVGALAWSWQPGFVDGCITGLADDPATQEVLRNSKPAGS